MINKGNISKKIGGFFSKGRVSYEKKLTNPRRDWFIGLLFFLVIIISGGVYSAHKFVAYRNLSTDGGDYNESLVRYNKNLIDEVLSVYDARKESFDALRSASVPEVAVPPLVPEPSMSTSTSEEMVQGAETSVDSSTDEPIPIEEVEMAH